MEQPGSRRFTSAAFFMNILPAKPTQPALAKQQTQKMAGPIVQPPPQRKTFTADAHHDAVSTPGFVNGTPDWVKPIIQRASQKHSIPTMLLSGLLKQESGFNPKAGSSAGAQGIAQFMPATAKGMGVDPYNPESSIMGAAQYLRRSWDKFGKPELALAAYNAGGGAVNQYGGIPPYKETQNYVKNIMAMAGELHQSAHGPYLETLQEIKKTGQMPKQVLGASSSPASPSPAPASPTSPPTNMANPYKNFVAPIPASSEVLPFTAPIPQDQVLMGKTAPVDAAIAKIRRARPHLSLSDKQLRDLYKQYGERLLAEL